MEKEMGKDSESLKDKIERWKSAAEIFLKNNTKAYIKDAGGDIYFCDILLVGDERITIMCFGPEQRKGIKYHLYWPLIVELDECREERG